MLVGVIAALVPALIAVATVTLLSWLHQAVTTDGLTRLDKTVASLFLQHLADVSHAADGELIIVELVS